jgi:DNA-binding Xre family transcriptional regulator
MAQTALLIATLKRSLKAKGKTYADVAQQLELSEPSIKRLFADEHLSLDRLDAICHMLGMEISDLVRQMEESRAQVTQLTHQQEREIVEDLELLLVTVCVFNYWSIEQITLRFTLSEEACVRKLLRLEKLGLVALLPGNRVRLLITKQFRWQENGPFEQFFRQHIGREYFQSSFQADGHCLLVLNGSLSPQSAAEFQRKLQRLAQEFSDRSREDAGLPIGEREGMTLVMAMRSWDYGLFQHLIKQ